MLAVAPAVTMDDASSLSLCRVRLTRLGLTGSTPAIIRIVLNMVSLVVCGPFLCGLFTVTVGTKEVSG